MLQTSVPNVLDTNFVSSPPRSQRLRVRPFLPTAYETAFFARDVPLS